MKIDARTRGVALLAMDGVAALALVYGLLLVAVFALGGTVPLTYDEAYNFQALSERYVSYSLFHYPAPNNHLLFTFAQSLLVPDFLVRLNPHFVRIPNLLYVLGAVLLGHHLLVRKGSMRVAVFVAAFFAVALISPISTIYLFVARGYLLGTLLLLAGCYALSFPPASRPFTGWWLVIGSVLTIPTFGYALPGLLAMHLLRLRAEGGRFDWRRSPVPRVLGILLVLYLPVAREMLAFSRPASGGWQASLEYVQLVGALLTNLAEGPGQFAVGGVLGALALLALIFGLRASLRGPRSPGVDASVFSAHLLMCVASYLACVVILDVSGASGKPFLRNATFAPVFVALGILVPLWQRRAWLLIGVAAAALGANAVVGAERFLGTLHSGDPNAYSTNFAVSTPTPLSRLLPVRGSGVVEIRASGFARTPAQLYGYSLGVPVAEEDLRGVPRCDIGRIPPPESQRVRVVLASGYELELCY